jgi:hypothetical protein
MKEAVLRWRLCAIEKLGNGSDKLGGRERLRQHDAIGYTFGRPIFSLCAAHVYVGKPWVDLSGLLGDFPTVHPAPQTDVGYERAVFAQATLKQGYRFLTRSGDSRFKAALGKGLVNDCLNSLVVFNNENYKRVFQRSYFGLPSQKHQAIKQKTGVLFREKCPKVYLAKKARFHYLCTCAHKNRI